MKKALGTLSVVLGAFFIAVPAFASVTATFTSAGNTDIYVSNPVNTGSFYGCLFTGTTATTSSVLPFNSGGTAGFVVVGSSTNIITQYSPLDAPISSSLLTYLNSNPGYYTMLGASGGSGSCLGDVLVNTTVEGTFYWNGGFTPAPAGDGDLTTHIIRITSPPAYATTTSPIPIGFDIYTSSSSPPMGYDISFRNTLTFETQSVSGWLVDSGYNSTYYGTTFHVATSSPLTGDGTWSMTVSLWSGGNGGPDPDPQGTEYRYFGRAVTSWFGLNFNDNAQHVNFPSFVNVSYASTSCAISFSGSFSLSDCVGYLMHPTENVFLSYSNVGSTLSAKFPFAYFSSIANTWTSLQASSTQNAPDWELSLHDLGIGSSTAIGNILPNVTIFSTSTVERYMPSGTLNFMKGLISLALILTLFADLFYGVKREISRQSTS